MNINMVNVTRLIKKIISDSFCKISEVDESNELKRVNGYSEAKEEIGLIEDKLNQMLSEEQRELLIKYSDLNSSLGSMEQEYYFKKGIASGLKNKEVLGFLDPVVIEYILVQ